MRKGSERRLNRTPEVDILKNQVDQFSTCAYIFIYLGNEKQTNKASSRDLGNIYKLRAVFCDVWNWNLLKRADARDAGIAHEMVH